MWPGAGSAGPSSFYAATDQVKYPCGEYRGADGICCDSGARSALAIDLICNDLSERLNPELGEGKGVNIVDIVDPDFAVFRFELIRQVPEQVLVATQDLAARRIV